MLTKWSAVMIGVQERPSVKSTDIVLLKPAVSVRTVAVTVVTISLGKCL